jgi:hypothetical protein
VHIGRGQCRHHSLGDPVGFLLVDVSWPVDHELGLQAQTSFFAVCRALAPRSRRFAACALSLQPRLRGAANSADRLPGYDGFGNAVRLMLERIARLAAGGALLLDRQANLI